MSDTKKKERSNLRYFFGLETEQKCPKKPQMCPKRLLFLKMAGAIRVTKSQKICKWLVSIQFLDLWFRINFPSTTWMRSFNWHPYKYHSPIMGMAVYNLICSDLKKWSYSTYLSKYYGKYLIIYYLKYLLKYHCNWNIAALGFITIRCYKQQ